MIVYFFVFLFFRGRGKEFSFVWLFVFSGFRLYGKSVFFRRDFCEVCWVRIYFLVFLFRGFLGVGILFCVF